MFGITKHILKRNAVCQPRPFCPSFYTLKKYKTLSDFTVCNTLYLNGNIRFTVMRPPFNSQARCQVVPLCQATDIPCTQSQLPCFGALFVKLSPPHYHNKCLVTFTCSCTCSQIASTEEWLSSVLL